MPRAAAVSKCLSPTRPISRLSNSCAAAKSGLDLARGEERVDARTVQFERLPAGWFPARDRLVERGIDLGGLLRLALKGQDRAELRHDLGAELGIIGDTDRPLNFQPGADQLFRIAIASLLDQNLTPIR